MRQAKTLISVVNASLKLERELLPSPSQCDQCQLFPGRDIPTAKAGELTLLATMSVGNPLSVI